MKLVTESWMMGRGVFPYCFCWGGRETTTGVKSLKYVLQMTASVWIPFNQTCDEESGDAGDHDWCEKFEIRTADDGISFKTAPWDAGGGTQRDKIHETMCRTMVHNIDGSTTKPRFV